MEEFTENQIKFLKELFDHNEKLWEKKKNEMEKIENTKLEQYYAGFWVAFGSTLEYIQKINEKFKIWMQAENDKNIID